jgi:hypothetical protein
MIARSAIALLAGFALVMTPVAAAAQRKGGGGGGMSRGGSRGSAPQSINRAGGNGGFNNGGYNNNRPGNNNNRPGNNRPGGNTNININNSTNVNVVGNNRGGYYGGGGCCYNNHYDVWDAVGTAAAVTATVAVTSAIIGSVTTTRPPDCVQSNYGNTTYLQCGSTWYQPAMVGSNVQYVVVARPY